jgi:hypothetical protein
MVTSMHFACRRLVRKRRRRNEIVRAVHPPSRSRFLVLLDSHRGTQRKSNHLLYIGSPALKRGQHPEGARRAVVGLCGPNLLLARRMAR